MTKNDSKMAKIEAYRAYLVAGIGKANDMAHYYSTTDSGEMDHRALVRQYVRESARLMALLDKAVLNPQEFADDADIHYRRSLFPLH